MKARTNYKFYTKEQCLFVIKNWGKKSIGELTEEGGFGSHTRVHSLVNKLRKEGIKLEKLDRRGTWREIINDVKKEIKNEKANIRGLFTRITR